MEVFQLGPFIIREDLLFYALCAVVGYVALQWRVRRLPGEHQKAVGDAHLQALLLGVICWKLSVVVFYPVLSWKNWSSVLFLTGGSRGVLLGICIGVLYLAYKARKQGIRLSAYGDSILFGYAAANIAFHTGSLVLDIGYHAPASFIYVVLSAGLIGWMSLSRAVPGEAVYFHRLLLWYSLGNIIISLFATGDQVIWSFTLVQIVYSVTSLYTLVFLNMIERTK